MLCKYGIYTVIKYYFSFKVLSIFVTKYTATNVFKLYNKRAIMKACQKTNVPSVKAFFY